MRVVVIVQARMGSERLPGKVIREVLGKPLLGYLLDRLKKVPSADAIVVATTTSNEEAPIIDLCQDVSMFRGSNENVLERYTLAARESRANAVVRITGDCPLMDPNVVEKIIQFFLLNHDKFDYISNTLVWTYPRGMDVEIFSMEALEKTFLRAQTKWDLEHVTSFIYSHPEEFRLGCYEYDKNASQYRLTVDTPEDFELVKRILEVLYPEKPDFSLEDILDLLEEHPEWALLNAHVKQKEQ